MIRKYEVLNARAKDYLLRELKDVWRESGRIEEEIWRCYKEIDMLEERRLLFVVEQLYKYKKRNGSVRYHFRGMITNLLVMYVLRLSNVDPIEYALPYELFNDKGIDFDVVNGSALDMVMYLDKYGEGFKIVENVYEVSDDENINRLNENDYLLIPEGVLDLGVSLKFNEFGILSTEASYRNKFVKIRIGEKWLIDKSEKGIQNVISNDFERRIASILKPKTLDDYVKIKSIGRGTNIWNENQEELVKEGVVSLDNLVATREDIFEYLFWHGIDREVAIEITNCIRKGYQREESSGIWDEYLDVMRKHGCDEWFMMVVEKILFVVGRGQAVSECLFAMDEKNYGKYGWKEIDR